MTEEGIEEGIEAGKGIIRASWAGTAVMAATAALAVVVPDRLMGPYVIVSLVLFAVGSVVFMAAFVRAVGRSREESIAVTELFFLVGRVPTRVRLHLLGSLGVQVAVALVAAIVRIYSPTAFGILAPVYGLAMAGLWSSCHGRFGPRTRNTTPTGSEKS